MMLDEFCSNTGYNRKYAIRLLNGPEFIAPVLRLCTRSNSLPFRLIGLEGL